MRPSMWVEIGLAGAVVACAMVVRARELAVNRLILHASAASKTDLAIRGLAGGAVRYVRREELLGLPQVSAVVSDDPDMPGVTMRAGGVRLDVLAQAVGADGADLVDAVCSDGYRAYFPREMIAAHAPFLVLTIDGMTPKDWAAKTKLDDPGPYLILYDGFKPAWRVLAHEDRPQLPTNIVQVGFGTQALAFGRIAPGGGSVREAEGFRIARQNCIRCHAQGETGGTKSGRSWSVLARDARERPEWFRTRVRDPKLVDAAATMPGNPEYDAATLEALRAYFSLQVRQETR